MPAETMPLLTRLQRVLAYVDGRGGDALETAVTHAATWYGPDCVRLEVEGESVQDEDDGTRAEMGTRVVRGYDLAGNELPVQLAGDDSEDAYSEALADWQQHPRGAAPEPCTLFEIDSDGAGPSRHREEAGTLESGFFFWGTGPSPYQDEQALLDWLSAPGRLPGRRT